MVRAVLDFLGTLVTTVAGRALTHPCMTLGERSIHAVQGGVLVSVALYPISSCDTEGVCEQLDGVSSVCVQGCASECVVCATHLPVEEQQLHVVLSQQQAMPSPLNPQWSAWIICFPVLTLYCSCFVLVWRPPPLACECALLWRPIVGLVGGGMLIGLWLSGVRSHLYHATAGMPACCAARHTYMHVTWQALVCFMSCTFLSQPVCVATASSIWSIFLP